MITTNQIVDAINLRLVELYPDWTVYVNRCPKKFERHSFLIESVKSSSDSASRKVVKVNAYFTITCFELVDDYRNSEDGALLDVQDAVINLFRLGHIKVGNRAIKVEASTGGADFDQAYVDLQLEYYDDRSDEMGNTTLMGDIEMNVKEE